MESSNSSAENQIHPADARKPTNIWKRVSLVLILILIAVITSVIVLSFNDPKDSTNVDILANNSTPQGNVTKQTPTPSIKCEVPPEMPGSPSEKSLYIGLKNEKQDIVLANKFSTLRCPQKIFTDEDQNLSEVFDFYNDGTWPLVYVSAVYKDEQENVTNKVLEINGQNKTGRIIWQKKHEIGHKYDGLAFVFKIIEKKYALINVLDCHECEPQSSQTQVINLLDTKSVNLGEVDYDNMLVDTENKKIYYKQLKKTQIPCKPEDYESSMLSCDDGKVSLKMPLGEVKTASLP